MGALGVREKAIQLVAKHRAATWFQYDHRRAGVDVLGECIQNLAEVVFGAIEEAIVVERTSAAQVLHGDLDLIPKVLQHVHSSLRCIGEEVVVEGVSPENDDWASLITWRTLTEPGFESLGS